MELRRELGRRWSEKTPTLALVLWIVRAEHGIGTGDPGLEPVREDSLKTSELSDSIYV